MASGERRVLIVSNYLPYTIKGDGLSSSLDSMDILTMTQGGKATNDILPVSLNRYSNEQPLCCIPIMDGEDLHPESPENYNYYNHHHYHLDERAVTTATTTNNTTATLSGPCEDDYTRIPVENSTPSQSPKDLLAYKLKDGEIFGSSTSSIEYFPVNSSHFGNNWRVVPYNLGNFGQSNAINSFNASHGSRVWIGTMSGSLPSNYQDRKSILTKLRESHNCIVVELPGQGQRAGNHYRYCKRIMWPIFHNMLPDHQLTLQTNVNSIDWKDYVQLNEAFAQVVLAEYVPGDIIWINDYHLMLLPQMLRVLLPDVAIGFFLHVPFPTSEIFRCLPVRMEILEGILAANLIGFQTYSYARHFFQSCTRILGYSCTPGGVQMEGKIVPVGIFPIGIDPSWLECELQNGKVKEVVGRLRERYAGKKVIVARDKVDSVKGIRQKLLGYSQFLEDNPDWRGRTVLIQVAIDGHGGRYLQMVSELVSKINTRFGSLEYSPVLLISQDIPFHQYLALLSLGDICLITSLRDGMNLMPHEFIICQGEKHGVLVISEFAGASTTCTAALRINPWDPMDIAEAIRKGLEMSDKEKLSQHLLLESRVKSATAQVWMDSFLGELIKHAEAERHRQSLIAPLLDEEAFLEHFTLTKDQRLIILDYDALIPSFKNISQSFERVKSMKTCLAEISKDPMNTIVLISERSAEQLEHTLSGLSNIILSAEDGYSCRLAGEESWQACTNEPDSVWWERVQKILDYYTERTPGSWIERKSATFIWHYDHADAIFGARQAKECQAHLHDVIGTSYPVHTIDRRKRLKIRLCTVGQRQAIRSMLKRIITNDTTFGFISIFVRARDDDDLYTFCREMIRRVLKLSPSSIRNSPDQSASSNNNGGFRSSPSLDALALEADLPIYVCAIDDDTLTLQAEQRIQNPQSLISLLTRTRDYKVPVVNLDQSRHSK